MNLEYPWHNNAWQKFTLARQSNHLPHALLLTGQQGVGKKNLAIKMIKSLLCLNPVNYVSCNQCKACKTYETGAHPDYLEVTLEEEKQQISVAQIRNLGNFLTRSRSFDGFRVILLHPIERMNNNAANSLLKSLEEPTKDTVIILLANSISQILPTIKSRCQQLFLPIPDYKDAIEWLNKNKQNQDIHSKDLLELAQNSPILALNIKQELYEQRNDFAEDLLSVINESQPITRIAKKWEKHNLNDLLHWQVSWLQFLIKKQYGGVNFTNEGNNAVTKFLSVTAKKMEDDTILWKLYQNINNQVRYIHTSVNPLIMIENMLTLWHQSIR